MTRRNVLLFTALAAWFWLAVPVAAHEHKPPHGGTLVVFGAEAAHLELVLEAASGKLTGYVLDGEAEKAVRVKQKDIELKLVLAGAETKELALTLKARANVLTGETEGDSSEFAGQADALKEAKTFDAVLMSIEIKGQTYAKVAFNFPKGNEAPDAAPQK